MNHKMPNKSHRREQHEREQYINLSFEHDAIDVLPKALNVSTELKNDVSHFTQNTNIQIENKGHRRQESIYQLTGLYVEHNSGDDSSPETTHDSPCVQPAFKPTFSNDQHTEPRSTVADTVINCHIRESTGHTLNTCGYTNNNMTFHTILNNNNELIESDEFKTRDCGILSCRPVHIQNCATIKMFVLLLSMLVTLQQALSSGYINSVVTTIEKRFEIPSSYSGLIASSYEIGNVITVIFVSYLGSRRHIPVWIGIGAVIMAIGSFVFVIPHFTSEPNPGISMANDTNDNICRSVLLGEQDMGLGRLSSGLSNPPLAPHTLREDNCIEGKSSIFGAVTIFVMAQLLLGCGGSPLFTLGTTYVDDHVKTESSSMYIGCMYSMAAFGPVLGFLTGAYLLSFHMDSLSSTIITINPGDRRWVGMWWGGFLLCGVLLLVVAIPFFSFPKVLKQEKKKLSKISFNQDNLKKIKDNNVGKVNSEDGETKSNIESAYGKDIKDIPQSMLRLLCNPVYIVTCLGACMELMIVSGFVVFLPKYLETQFSLGKSQASVFTGSIAIPGACIGIFTGGCILKRFQLKPKGAVQFVLLLNLICLSCYGMLFFLGCENLKMAGTTIPYYQNAQHISIEPFQVNLTAACNFGCECLTTDVEPVCGNNGLTYFSPCHAGCTAFSSKLNYTNCACVQSNVSSSFYNGPVTSEDGLSGLDNFNDVTVIPVATAGPCVTPCRTIYPFLILLFFMTFIVASTQMPLLMIVLRSVNEEERSFALGMQFVIFRLFGYIPAPILFGNLIDSTCLLWKSSCGEKGGRCLIYDIEKFRYKYVGLCATVKIVALVIFILDWWLIRRRKQLEKQNPVNIGEAVIGSIISLDKLFEEKYIGKSAYQTENVLNGEEYGHNIGRVHSRKNSSQILQDNEFEVNKNRIQCIKNIPQTRSKKHFRSASCDVKMLRNYLPSGEGLMNTQSQYKNLKNRQSHSRNNSSDLNFKYAHIQNISHDGSSNCNFIINQLKTPQDEEDLIAGCGHLQKKHSRNHSYDQIYIPNNIRFDADFLKISNKKNVRVLKNVDCKSKNSNEKEQASRGHSRMNSRDMKSGGPALLENLSDANILRHRRTNSKEFPSINNVENCEVNHTDTLNNSIATAKRNNDESFASSTEQN